MKKIFITGIAGMLGKSLVRILEDARYKVSGCDIIDNDYGNAHLIRVTDLDGDGDLDVVVTATENEPMKPDIVWYERIFE